MKKFLRRRYPLLILILVIIALGFLVYNRINNKNLEKETVFNPQKDKIVNIKRQDIKREITLSGTIKADEHVHLQFQTSGLVSWVGVKQGDTVKKYQAIASLDKRQLKKTLERYLNSYMSNRWDFEQTQDDYKDTRDNKLITDEIQRIIDKTQFSLNNAVIDVELQDLAMRLATVTSPIDGVVLKAFPAYAGTNVIGYQADYEIVNPNTVYISAKVDEEDVVGLYLGQQAQIILDNFPDEPLESYITYISFDPVAGESSTTYEVRLAINRDNSNLTFRLGMNADVKIVTDFVANTLSLPYEAINEADDQQYVLVKSAKNSLERKNVVTGIESVDDIEIVSGLNENDQVVIKQ